jgi:predicted ATPase/class 3 adenylate cyclase
MVRARHHAAVRRLPTGTVTFLFTDIEGSTRLLQALGSGYRDVLERHAALMRTALQDHGGVEVGTEGDSFFAVFEAPRQAIAAVAAAQRALRAEPWPGDRPVRVRMGLLTGEGSLGGDSYVGIDVHRAARIGAAAHGGQVLVSASTRSLVQGGLPDGVDIREAGTHRLKDLERPEPLFQLVIDGLEPSFPPLRTLEAPSNLPVEVSSFIGRTRELGEIGTLFETARLVTLVGPGGTGKTRLAIRAAATLRDRWSDGASFVNLSALVDPDLVGPEIARSIGLADEPDRDAVAVLREHLATRELLLVLDNFEQLLPARALVADLLQVAPRLRLLVTSRSLLNVSGERRFDVPPLTLPSARDTSNPEYLLGNDAIRLFVERARAARPDFELTPAVADAVAGICIRLDGLPLAIELAASRVALLEPREILARLQQRLPVLAKGASDAPARQQTLAAAIAWSDDLLQPAIRRLFHRLSIFAGGWTLDAAEAVANRDLELDSTLEALAELADQSLVIRSTGPSGTRFHLLETIRQYGLEQLAADAETEELEDRHSRYFRDLARVATSQTLVAGDRGRVERLEADQDNIRAVLDRSLERRDAETGLVLATAMWRLWMLRGYLREGRARLEALLAVEPPASALVQARAYGALGGLTYWLADTEATERAYEAALRLAREAGDREAEAEALYDIAFIPTLRGELEEALRRLRVALAGAEAIGREDLVANARTAIGMHMTVAGDSAGALEVIELALASHRAHGDQFQIAWTLAAKGEALRLLGRLAESQELYVEGLRRNEEAGNLPGIASGLLSIVSLESTAGRHARAMRLKGVVAGIKARTGASAPPLMLPGVDAEERARSAIGDAAVDAELALGTAMPLEDLLAYASVPIDRAGPPEAAST